jgi:PAS domain S-box-containing protein
MACVRAPDGRPEYFIAMAQDVTQRHAAKQALRESEEKFRLAFDNANSGMCLVAPTGRLVQVNQRMTAIFGYSQTELLAMRVNDLALPDDDSVSPVFVQAALADNQYSAVFEKRYRHRDGHLIHCQVASSLARDSEGNPLYFISQVQDITERKRIQAALESSEEKFSRVFQSAVQLMSISRVADGAIVDINPAGAAMFGYSRAELIGKTSLELRLWPQDTDRERFLAELKATGMLATPREVHFRKKHGEIRTVLVTACLLTFGDDAVMLATGADITERKAAEQQIQETLQLLRVASRAADIGVWSWDLASGRLDWDDRLCAWYAVPEDVRQRGLLYEFWQSRLDPDDRERAEAVLTAALRDPTRYEDVFRIRLPDGRVRFMQTAAVVELDPGGNPWRVVGINRDITTQREQEAALRESERKYRLITESMRDVVWVLDLKTLRFPYISPSIETMTGYTPTEYLRQPIGAFLTPEASSQLKALLEQRAAALLSGQIPSGHAYIDEVEHPHKDGYPIATEVIMTFWLNEPTGQVEVRGVSRDISERKRVQEELRIAKQEAEGANQAKSAFLANMSHEIRTPMNAVLGLAQLLEQEPLESGQLAMLRHIREAGDHLLNVINDILDFSKIEAGQLRMDPRPFSVSAILQHLDHLLRHVAETKGLRLVIDTPPPGLGDLIADPQRLEQVLVNLINNAIKFTKAGEVRLSVAVLPLEQPEPDQVGLRFAVKDTGIGIVPEAQAKLFQSFSQADASITRRFGGTGLGLAISKRIVEMMGGQIGVESREGEGSTFWFAIPLRIASAETALPGAAASQEAPGGPRLVGLRVLAVDDNRINLLVLENALKRQGATVKLAADGQEALHILGTTPRDFDVVLMDIQMPVMDGLVATREIRRNPALRNLPVIALTAGVLTEEREAAKQAGMNDFLAKPLDFEQMNAVLSPYVPSC